LVVNDKHNYDPLCFFNTGVAKFGYFSDKSNQDILEYEQDIYNDLSSNDTDISIRCAQCTLNVNKNTRVLVMTSTVKKMYEVIHCAENEKETIINKSADFADVLIYITSSFFKKGNNKKIIMHKI
jgi:hypothetical protein